MSKTIIALFFFAGLRSLSGGELHVSGIETELYVTPEFNRTNHFCWDISVAGAVKVNELYTIKGGIALGAIGGEFEIKAFTGTEAAFFERMPIYFSLVYNYNGIPEYEVRSHSIVPLVSYNTNRAGISLGANFRLTSFFGAALIFEPVLSFSVYVNIIDNGLLLLGLRSANFNNFTFGNLGAYYLNLNSIIHLTYRLSLINEIELHQRGSIALAAQLYGIVYRSGVLYSW